ncbi:MAG: ABC transporter substrate-binding protein [Alphaproteobacteria bacterium]|nr:ABC transporter substrate-binding protein [Alphaproteobacteria bacterium]
MGVEGVISGDASTPLRRDVVDAVWWIYRNHEAIKASCRKVFRATDRQVFP